MLNLTPCVHISQAMIYAIAASAEHLIYALMLQTNVMHVCEREKNFLAKSEKSGL